MLRLPIVAASANEKANPVKASLLGLEAIVLVTKYLAHLLQQAFGLGKIGDRVHRVTTMYKNTALTPKDKMSSGGRDLRWDSCNPAFQLIPSDKLDSQNIRRSTSR
jgi:hypothetical protein